MNGLLKRLLVIALAFHTAMSGIPVTVMAEDTGTETETPAEQIIDEEKQEIVSETEEVPEEVTVPAEEEETAEPVITEEPEETPQAEEPAAEEVQEPAETEEPVTVEEPGETEVPEEPEETEIPQETVEPEETAEPTETETPAETPEGEPLEEPEEEVELDFSEPFQLNITPVSYTSDISISSLTYDTVLDDGTYNFSITNSTDLENVYLIAVKDEVTWFAWASDPLFDGSADVQFKLPAGEYELRAGFYQFGELHASADYYSLVVFDAPKVVGTGNYSGVEYGYIDIDLTDILTSEYFTTPGLNKADVMLNIYDHSNSVNLVQMENYVEGNIFRIILGDAYAYDGDGYFKDFRSGSFDLSYSLLSSGAKVGDYIFVGSDTAHADVTEEVKPNHLNPRIEGTMGSTLFYKGQTAQIIPFPDETYGTGTHSEGFDSRVTYKSEDPKYLKVDAKGLVTVVALPATDYVYARITVTSVADPALAPATLTFTVVNIPAGKADMKILYEGQQLSTLNWPINKQIEHDHIEEIIFSIGEPNDNLVNMPVNFSVSGEKAALLNYPADSEPSSTKMANMQSDGTAHIYVRIQEGGIYKVTVSTPIGKSGIVTINADGFNKQYGGGAPSKQSQYYINGKTVTGWVMYDSLTGKHILGKNVNLYNVDPTHQFVFYLDPATGNPVMGTPGTDYVRLKKIGGKLYAFDDQAYLIIPAPATNWLHIFNEDIGAEQDIYLASSGEIMTGWQDSEEGAVYLDPDLGYLVTNSFVPARGGKGLTYVNNEGKAEGIYYENSSTTETLPLDARNGLYRVFASDGDKYFWMKNGVIQTGWIYLHYDGAGNPVWNTTAKGAYEKMYFDPNNNGEMARGTFRISGKEYRSDEAYDAAFWGMDFMTVQTLNSHCFGEGKFPEKYGILNGVVVDADGAVVKNKLVKVAYWRSGAYDRYYVYADEDGELVTDAWQAVNGTMYYFDSTGKLVTEGIPTDFYFLDEGYNSQTVYCSVKSAKKPTQGYNYYLMDGAGKQTKLTSLLIYDSHGDAYALDAKGNLVINGVVNAKAALGEGTQTYVTDSEGMIVRSADSAYYQAVTVKGKTYIVDINGIVYKNSPEPVFVRGLSEEMLMNELALTDKNGAVYKKTFRTLSNSTYGQYKVYCMENGTLAYPTMPIYDDGTNEYFAFTINKKLYFGFYFDGYLAFVIPGKTAGIKTGWFGDDPDRPIYINKDGSVKTGFIKRDGVTHYLLTGTYYSGEFLTGWTTSFDDGVVRNILYKIGGKNYFFDQYGRMVTGWVYFEHALSADLNDYMTGASNSVTRIDNAAMYFDPKTGAAVTSKAKVLVPETVNGELSLGYEENFTNGACRINTTSSQATLNFTKDGVLIRGQVSVINKKLTATDDNGTVLSGNARWTDANKISYVKKNGVLATGRTKIDGTYYYFDPATGLKVTNALRKTGKKWYYYGEFGRQETPVLNREFTVTLPVHMAEYGQTASVWCGSTAPDKVLTAVWNKDGSLAKIVYAESGKPAAGESLSMGLWKTGDPELCTKYIMEGLNGYVLDKKGLPMTGVVKGLNTDGSSVTYTIYTGKDGGRVVNTEEGFSLTKIGKKYYVMYGGVIDNTSEGVLQITDWSTLPAADQKSLDEFAKVAEASGTGLYVMKNIDGTVAANTTRIASALIDGEELMQGTWTTNKLGVVLDLVAPMYKVGKKTYISNTGQPYIGKTEFTTRLMKFTGSTPVDTEALVKLNGNQITGFYDAETGKALSGTYFMMSGPGGQVVMWLNKGQPQTGNRTIKVNGMTLKFYVHPNMAFMAIR